MSNETPFIMSNEKFKQGLDDGTIVILSDEEANRIRGEGKEEKKNDKEKVNIDVEHIKEVYNDFLKKTFTIWYDEEKAKVEQIPIIIDPTTQDYKTLKSDIDEAKFGEYTVNPETQGIDFENAKVFILPEVEQKALEGKELWEVAEFIKTKYGNTHHIPGIEYWKWISEQTDQSKISDKLKDGNYYFNFGSLVRNSDGHFNVPCESWSGSEWNRNGYWLDDRWSAGDRVVLLEK